MRPVTEMDLRGSGIKLQLQNLPFTYPGHPDSPVRLAALNLDVVTPESILALLRHLKARPEQLVVLDCWGVAELDLPASLREVTAFRSVYRKSDFKQCRLFALPPLARNIGSCGDGPFLHDVAFLASLSNGLDVCTFDALAKADPVHQEMAAKRRGEKTIKGKSREDLIVAGMAAAFTERGVDGVVRTKVYSGTNSRELVSTAPSLGEVMAASRKLVSHVMAANATCVPPVPDLKTDNDWRDRRPAENEGDQDGRALSRNLYGRKLILSTGSVSEHALRQALTNARAGVAVAHFNALPAAAVEIVSASRMAVVVGDIGSLPFNAPSDWIVNIPRDEAADVAQVAWQKLKTLSDSRIIDLGKQARQVYEQYFAPNVWAKRIEEAVQR